MIWVTKPSLQELNQRAQQSLMAVLGIEYIEWGERFLRARMPVDRRTMQPMQVLHGGATCALVESVGSTAANCCVNPGHVCMGLEINVNHIKTMRGGFVIATAEPFHLGRTTQVWDVKVHNEEESLVAVGRL